MNIISWTTPAPTVVTNLTNGDDGPRRRLVTAVHGDEAQDDTAARLWMTDAGGGDDKSQRRPAAARNAWRRSYNTAARQNICFAPS